MLLCEEAGINLREAILAKLKKNNEKYPIEKSKGKYTKYTDL